MPAWQREGPLLYGGGHAAVRARPGHRCRVPRAAPGEPQLQLDLGSRDGAGVRPRVSRQLKSQVCARRTTARSRLTASMALIVHKYGGTSMGSTERIRSVAQARRQVGARRPPDGGRALGHERRDQSPARPGQGAVARRQHARGAARTRRRSPPPASRCRSGLLALALQAQGLQAVSYAGWQVPIRTDSAYTKARISSIDDARVRADLAAGKVVIITGFQGIDAAGQRHHAGPRRQRHLGGGGGGGDEGRRVPDLHRRRRRLHHRPAHRARGAAAAHHQLRGDAGDGQPGLQGAADPLGGVRRQVPRAAARAVELHALGHRRSTKKPRRAP